MANEENTKKSAAPFLLSLILLILSVLASWSLMESIGRDEDAEFMDQMEDSNSEISYLQTQS